MPFTMSYFFFTVKALIGLLAVCFRMNDRHSQGLDKRMCVLAAEHCEDKYPNLPLLLLDQYLHILTHFHQGFHNAIRMKLQHTEGMLSKTHTRMHVIMFCKARGSLSLCLEIALVNTSTIPHSPVTL